MFFESSPRHETVQMPLPVSEGDHDLLVVRGCARSRIRIAPKYFRQISLPFVFDLAAVSCFSRFSLKIL